MFLKKIRSFFAQVGVRLTLWHLLIFFSSSLLLFWVFFLLFSHSLEKNDHQFIEAKLNEYNAFLQIGGIVELEKYIRSSKISKEGEYDIFIRIQDGNHNSKFFHTFGNKSVFDIKEIEHGLYETNQKKQWFYIKTKRDDDDLEVLSIQLANGDFFQVGKTVNDRDELLEQFMGTFAEIVFVALLLGGIGGYFLASRILRPIRELISTLKSIEKGDEDVRVPLSQHKDELEELSKLFNQMLDRIRNSNQAMRQTLDVVAHELRTPLTSIRGHAEISLQNKNLTSAQARIVFEDCIEGVDEILAEFKMMTDITEVESGLQNLKKETVDIKTLIQDIIDLYEIVAEQKDIHLKLTQLPTQQSCTIFADKKKIRQALANLVDNAIKYSPQYAEIHLFYFKFNKTVIIKVQDQGMGINESDLPLIWKRLYRGENSRNQKGIGLGLSLVKSIVEAHNGSVSVESIYEKGSTFILTLPL